jgi:hypothetical protein
VRPGTGTPAPWRDEDPDSYARQHTSSEVLEHLSSSAQDFLVFKTGLLMADSGDDPVKKAARDARFLGALGSAFEP